MHVCSLCRSEASKDSNFIQLTCVYGYRNLWMLHLNFPSRHLTANECVREKGNQCILLYEVWKSKSWLFKHTGTSSKTPLVLSAWWATTAHFCKVHFLQPQPGTQKITVFRKTNPSKAWRFDILPSPRQFNLAVSNVLVWFWNGHPDPFLHLQIDWLFVPEQLCLSKQAKNKTNLLATTFNFY